jgi:hypothetical protein
MQVCVAFVFSLTHSVGPLLTRLLYRIVPILTTGSIASLKVTKFQPECGVQPAFVLERESSYPVAFLRLGSSEPRQGRTPVRKDLGNCQLLAAFGPRGGARLTAERYSTETIETTGVTLHLNPGILPLCYRSMSGI